MKWYHSITREQWNALIAAKLGWMLDAMDFVLFLMAINALKESFGFDNATAGSLATAALIASAIGGLLFGIIADRIGRTRALMATILIYSLCTLGTATSQNFTQLMLWRLGVGFGMGGEWASGAVLVSETWPAEHRGKAIGIMQSGWAIGYILAAIAAAAILPHFGWRWLFVVGILPAFFTLWIRRHVAEPEIYKKQKSQSEGNTLAIIFKKPFLSIVIKGLFVTSLVMFGYWGFFTWIPSYLGSPISKGGAGLNVFKTTAWIIPMQIGAFFGYATFGFISDRIGRRPAFTWFLVIAALLVPAYGIAGRHPAILLAIGPLVGFFGHGFFSVFGAMLAELFPTSVRATAQGFIYNCGRVMGGLAPFVIGTLADRYGIGSALAITAAFFLTGAIAIRLLPETARTQLI